jgi:WD40 repeat protein
MKFKFVFYFLAIFLVSCTATPKIYLKSGDMSMELKRSAHFVRAVAYSSDGRYAITGAFDNTLRLWDTTTGRQMKQFKGHTGVVYSAVFSPDGKYVLSGSGDMTVRLWDVATGTEVRQFKAGKTGMFNIVWSVAFSPDVKVPF